MADNEAHRARLLEKIRRDCGQTLLAALDDPTVVEVMRNPDGRIWIDVAGEGLKDTGHVMPAAQAESLLSVCATILNTELTRESPVLEGEFPLDKSRLEGLVYPVVQEPTFAIRKKARSVFTLGQYVASGIMSPTYADEIRTAVTSKRNILIVGGTGSGKTTLANGVIAAIAELCPTDRIVAIEDTMELQVPVENNVLLRSSEHVSMARLLRATMRLRPDRILVGETRGAEAYTLMKAWNSGHPGGIATIHADSAALGLRKLGQYAFEDPAAHAFKAEMMADIVVDAVHVVVFIEKKTSARAGRVVSDVCRVVGHQGGVYQLAPIQSPFHHQESSNAA